MRLTKKIVNLFLTFLFTISLYNCSSGCENGNPTAKVTNQGTEEISVQVKTTGGNTENLNNVLPGNSSEDRSFAPGEITYTIVLTDKTEIVEVVSMGFCEDYTITLNQDNTITTSSEKRD